MVWNANCRNVLKTFRLKPKIDMPRGGSARDRAAGLHKSPWPSATAEAEPATGVEPAAESGTAPPAAARWTAAASANPDPVLPDTVAKGAPAVKSKAAPKGKASAKPKAQRLRYYAVTRVMQENDNRLLGIHHCQWSVLEGKFPTGHFIGSGSQLKGFDTLEGAVEYWLEAGWALKAPYFEPPAPDHHI